MRLTLRGKVVIAILWTTGAFILANILPFWWTKF